MQRQPDIINAARQATGNLSPADVAGMITDPVILLSAPRSGSTLLYEQLAQLGHFWTIGGESHAVFRAFPALRAENPQLDSMALNETHADEITCDLMRRCFLYFLRNRQGVPYLSLPPQSRPTSVCMLEKTPRNALNIPFLLKVFPKARFIYLRRDPRQTVSSLIEAWTLGLQTGRFVTFRDLPGWPLPGWCFLLPRGWREMSGKSIAEIAAFQWSASNVAIMDGLSALGADRFTTLDYSSLTRDPAAALTHLNQVLGFEFTAPAIQPGTLPLSRTTVSAPNPEKWRRHEAEIEALWPALSQTQTEIEAFCASANG